MVDHAEIPEVTPGIYRHFKGRLYRVLAVAFYTGKHGLATVDCKWEGFPEDTKLVVYVGLYENPHGNRVLTRPASEWSEYVETTLEQRVVLGGDQNKPYRRRFERVGN